MQTVARPGMGQNHAPAQTPGSDTQKKEMVRFSAVSKEFAGNIAVDQVSLTSHAGTVHSVTGENGAGKSTLMKMLSGVHAPSSGSIMLDEAPFAPQNPKGAQLLGISTIYQELNLIPNLTVAENLFFGREPRRGLFIDRAAVLANAKRLLADVGLDLEPTRACGRLTIAEQQFVEIAKGLSLDAKVYIFDEPTAALNIEEVERLFTLIERLRSEGKLIYYISHRLDEIFHLSDAIAVMKDGQLSAEFQRGETDEAGLIRAMVGRDLGDYFPPRRDLSDAAPLLSVSDLQPHPHSPEVSFTLRKGEILGLAGLEGQGQRDIIRAIVGLDAPHSHGVKLRNKDLNPHDGIVSMVSKGIGFVPEDRKTEGLFLEDPIDKNMALGLTRNRKLASKALQGREEIKAVSKRMRLKAASLKQEVGRLSGGNQQKVMLGRWLLSGVEVLVIEEPTRGVDVGAKAEIYEALRDFCAEGYAILLTSSEMAEVIGLCDRILVVRQGRITAEIAGRNATEETILAHAITDQGESIP